MNQITVIETQLRCGFCSSEVFHLFFLVCKFETKNAGYKQKQEDLNVWIGNASTSCLLLSARSSPRLVLHGVSTLPLPGSTRVTQVWEITNQNGCLPQQRSEEDLSAGWLPLSRNCFLISCLHPPNPLKTVLVGFYKEGNYNSWDHSSSVN